MRVLVFYLSSCRRGDVAFKLALLNDLRKNMIVPMMMNYTIYTVKFVTHLRA